MAAVPPASAASAGSVDLGLPGSADVRAPYFLIQAALPSLRESPVRSVVNISSSSGTLRLSGQSVYGIPHA